MQDNIIKHIVDGTYEIFQNEINNDIYCTQRGYSKYVGLTAATISERYKKLSEEIKTKYTIKSTYNNRIFIHSTIVLDWLRQDNKNLYNTFLTKTLDKTGIALSANELDISVVKKRKKRIKQLKKEKEIQTIYAKQINGEVEIICPAGRIDVLSSDKIVEIKKIQDWKQAVGQILIYGNYYPNHDKQIVLFGENDIQLRELITENLSKHNITVFFIDPQNADQL